MAALQRGASMVCTGDEADVVLELVVEDRFTVVDVVLVVEKLELGVVLRVLVDVVEGVVFFVVVLELGLDDTVFIVVTEDFGIVVVLAVVEQAYLHG